ncbi:V-set and immunoglobulin domain-containing protein 10 [Bombina bombina]|uniref:V-set and immunoglobulin domain-containing protein 10 n=1 Tax=Bombina bombina TaxID=8345 RepID=UPI00235A55B1|nr:V-set and immunoglobulin domain-containing protein 10 [Bombina bombina]
MPRDIRCRYPNGTIQCLADFIKDIVDLQCSWPGGNPAVELHLQFNNISMSGTNYIVSSIHQKDITLNTFLYCRGSQEKLIQTCYLDIDTPKSVGFNNDSTTEGILGNSVTLTLNLQNRGERQTNLYHVLPANFTWYKLATDPSPLPSEKPFFVISTAYQSSLTINPVTKEVGGRYMCIATNPLGNTSFVFYLNVTEAPPSGLSGGAIAGIVIGVLVSVAIIAIMVFFIIKATKGSTNGERGPFTGHVYENTRSQSENTYSRTIPGTQQVEMSNSANPVPVYEQLMVKNEAVYNTIMPSYKK